MTDGQPPRALIKVAIIEDRRELCETLALLINGTEGFNCVGSFRILEETLDRRRGPVTN